MTSHEVDRRGVRARRRRLVLAGALLAVGGPWVAATSASANGGVNIMGWCRQHYNSQYFNAVVVSNNVYGWRCQYGSDAGTRLNVDMNGACAYTYPQYPGWAKYTNYSNPYSWYCVY